MTIFEGKKKNISQIAIDEKIMMFFSPSKIIGKKVKNGPNGSRDTDDEKGQ